jgi:multimeric flavodoxin WrbA
MKLLIITGNPKKDGLCDSVTKEVIRGAQEAGATVEVAVADKLERCHVCGNGWGTCRGTHKCAFGTDGFDTLQADIASADAFCLITPVYWQEMAEGLKSFLDRLRRCEFGKGKLSGKQVLLIASPGGSGNGALECLTQMDRFCRHTGAVIFDYIGVNRWNSDYKRAAAYAAANALASGRKNGDTVDNA